MIGIALSALGIGVATERGQGWLAVKRASPMPVSAYFTGKFVMTVLFSAVLVALLALLGVVFGQVHLGAAHWAALASAAAVVNAIGFGLLFSLVALAAYRRDEGRTYG